MYRMFAPVTARIAIVGSRTSIDEARIAILLAAITIARAAIAIVAARAAVILETMALLRRHNPIDARKRGLFRPWKRAAFGGADRVVHGGTPM